MYKNCASCTIKTCEKLLKKSKNDKKQLTNGNGDGILKSKVAKKQPKERNVVMFCYDRLLWKIHSYGFKKLCQSVGIKLPRLISVVDGEDGFTLKEIERISEELDISASDKEAYFFTTKVACKQLYDK